MARIPFDADAVFARYRGTRQGIAKARRLVSISTL